MSTRDAVRRFFGAILIVVGGLFMALCGGCALLFSVASLLEFRPENAIFLGLPWLLAAVPVIAGWFMYRTGRHLMKPLDAASPSGDASSGDPA